MLTGKGDAIDRVVGLELGADDYLAKPFELRELLARVRAVLWRTAATEALPSAAQRYAFEGWLFDVGRRSLTSASGEGQASRTASLAAAPTGLARAQGLASAGPLRTNRPGALTVQRLLASSRRS